MKRPFRLKDPVTGLYYCPLRKVSVNPDKHAYGDYVKSNLSKKGKVYFSAQKLEKQIYDHTSLIDDGHRWPSGRKYYRPTLRKTIFVIEHIQFDEEDTKKD